MGRKLKRAAVLAVMIYILVNFLAWGLMKAYINSYNAVNDEKLVMAQITENSGEVEISVMGSSFCISGEKKDADSSESAFMTFIPLKIRAVSEIFRQTGQNIVQALHLKNQKDSC